VTIIHPPINKVALITGASRGSGRECAIALARHGYNVVINYLTNCEEAIKTQRDAQGFGITAISIQADVADKRQVDRMVGAVLDKFGQIDVLVNSAGVSEIKPIEDIDEASWNRIMDINLKGTFFCSQAVLKHMKLRRQGRIINIASQAGQTGGYFIGAHYSVSKAGIICLTKSLAKVGAAYGILVNCVSPGLIDTDMSAAYPPQLKEDLIRSIPLGRMGQPKEVASVVVFLASEEASYITGADIPVNGGMFMP
jgi:3-oxoacyl-[acyl-carrier protein] reductase